MLREPAPVERALRALKHAKEHPPVGRLHAEQDFRFGAERHLGAAGGELAISLERPIDYGRAPRARAWWGA